ncbi:type II toxin-antitoxin system VapB family antitoxin [Reyranella sp.]|jgi:antitoxin VapB|uniref:type II toxin-antitoxin system VapB family antitoxin n=1 Tax=Reyranella sp. TaxID=1929291 RepID=UPI0037840BC0
MAFHVRDAETDALVRELAAKHKIGLTEAVRMAVRNELQREQEAVPLKVRIAALRAEVLKRPATGLEADKAFFDDLSGEP